MDSAYDHIQEESYPEDPTTQAEGSSSAKPANADFNSEIQDAYKAISSSPWAARLGGFLGSVKKQGEQYYDGARASAPAATLTTGLTTLIGHTRNLSVNQTGEASSSDGTSKEATTPPHPDRPDSLPADIVKEAEGILSRFRAEAAKRLKDIEKAEDAADEALLKFGTNISNFLKEAVTIAPPTEESGADPSKVLFESKDAEGKRVIHTTRFDAQIHVIHSSLDSFLRDPVSPEWESWRQGFDVEMKTDAIGKDLEKYEELRRAMEKLVPERVEYASFWERYYFLRYVIESEEQRRREMLKASAPIEEEEVAWDEDSEDDDDESPTPSKVSPESTSTSTPAPPSSSLAASIKTLKPAESESEDNDSLKPSTGAEPRRSNDEKSVADSDASYDLVSGATSRAPGSPQDKKKIAEESDEEDWE